MTGYLCTGSLCDNDCLVLQQLIEKERSFTAQIENKSPRMDISKYLRDHKSILSFSCCGAVLFCSCIQLFIFFSFYLIRCLSDELNRFKMFSLNFWVWYDLNYYFLGLANCSKFNITDSETILSIYSSQFMFTESLHVLIRKPPVDLPSDWVRVWSES